MPSPLDIPTFRAGAPALAADMNKVASAVRRQTLQPGQFQTGAFVVQRPIRGGGGAASVATTVALLFESLEAATLSASASGGGITPSAVVAQCVLPLDDGLAHQTDENGVVVYDAVNACWPTAIKAGDGAEQTTGDPPVGTGNYNELPLAVEGLVEEYEEGDPPVTKKRFVITSVVNPCVIYEGTLDAAVSGGTMTVTPAADIWGKRPSGPQTVENIHGWDADAGAKVTVLRGYDRNTALNVDCPA